MQRLGVGILYLLVALLVAACVLGADLLLVSPFSDAEIRASLVDTWQVQAVVTAAILVFCALAFSASLVTAFVVRQVRTRRIAMAAAALAVLAACLSIAGHAALTKRTTELTGQTFSAFYGLF